MQMTFQQAGRLPDAADNCAIAIRRIDAGTEITFEGNSFALSHTVLEGHRFVVRSVATGTAITSWGLPFGRALRPLAPGDYVCNATMIEALQSRHVDFPLPAAPNFEDYFQPYVLDERTFAPAEQVKLYEHPRTFLGFARGGGRGAGTRNHIVVLGTSSLTGSFARVLASKFQSAAKQFPNIDGVVAIAHTEGGEAGRPNNLELTLRTLAGFVVNPNVGALLAIDYGSESVNNDTLREWMRAHGYPLDDLPHQFLRLGKSFSDDLATGERFVSELLAKANATPRTPQPMRHLKIGLQCGGSDAFSGVSGNPLAGIITREVVRHGGAANLAETDELHGAESYVLAKVRDLDTARKFLHTLDEFEERLGWHGVSGQSNPSGGNIFRGLYNIAIKSIGAARKKDPSARLDYVIGFGELMREPGFCFMDSPGNDLESIAGQVAAGCNLIVFSTGNGSVTNHPFVPTIKIMTNSGRFNLLSRDMDLNAGRYLDGEPLEKLGEEAFEYTVNIASGQRSVGEKAGHSQAQLWREWRQTSTQALSKLANRPKPNGEPVRLRETQSDDLGAMKQMLNFAHAAPRTRLIIPTSLCAGQVGKQIADKLNAQNHDSNLRYVALPHTEGCGVSGEAIEILEQTIAGYAVHPLAERTLLLEHGCEKTHNDAIRNFLAAHGVDYSQLGFASIQLDGGIEKVTDKVANWFASDTSDAGRSGNTGNQRSGICIGITARGELPPSAAAAFALVARALCEAGGSVVVPQSSSLLKSSTFTTALFSTVPNTPTLAYGQPIQKPGFHVMESASDHLVENLTGLGACGAEALLVHVSGNLAQAHPLVPTLQVTSVDSAFSEIDLCLPTDSPQDAARAIANLLSKAIAGDYAPRAQADGLVDFQMTRGWLGVST